MVPTLLADGIFGAELFLCLAIVMYMVFDCVVYNWEGSLWRGLSRGKRWYYASYACSTIYSVYLTYIAFLGLFDCRHPNFAQQTLEGSQLSKPTMFTSSYCRDVPSDLQIRGNAIVIGVMTYDLIL